MANISWSLLLTPKWSRWRDSTTGKNIYIFYFGMNCSFNLELLSANHPDLNMAESLSAGIVGYVHEAGRNRFHHKTYETLYTWQTTV